jgi:ABC-2 type transport system ATP-binding protein
MTAQPAIEVRSLSHSYDERAALQDVSFSVETGTLFGLLGPNGGGKTTLFRILSTLIHPTAGSALLHGIDVVKQPFEARRQLGVVFQAPSVDGALTVEENLRHLGHLYGFTGTELRNRIKVMLQRVGLEDRKNDRAETLSGGMRRRVELGKGLLHEPRILLLDEPTSGLDAGARREFKLYLQELCAREEITVLLTTHLMDEADICDRLAILDHGRLVVEGTPAALKETIGGDVLAMTSPGPQDLCENIRQKFGGEPTVVEDTVRLERDEGHKFVTTLIEAFPGQIQSITVSKPTLEDVFVHHTGHGFWENSQKSDTI